MQRNIAPHETAICRNQYNFTGDRKNLTNPQQTNKQVTFHFTTMQGQALFFRHILTCVFVNLSSNKRNLFDKLHG